MDAAEAVNPSMQHNWALEGGLMVSGLEAQVHALRLGQYPLVTHTLREFWYTAVPSLTSCNFLGVIVKQATEMAGFSDHQGVLLLVATPGIFPPLPTWFQGGDYGRRNGMSLLRLVYKMLDLSWTPRNGEIIDVFVFSC